MEIEDHYSQLSGTQLPWEISKVDLDMSAHRVDIEIEYHCCPINSNENSRLV